MNIQIDARLYYSDRKRENAQKISEESQKFINAIDRYANRKSIAGRTPIKPDAEYIKQRLSAIVALYEAQIAYAEKIRDLTSEDALI